MSGTWGSMERGIFCINFIDCIVNQKLEWSVEQRDQIKLKQTIPWENFIERPLIF